MASVRLIGEAKKSALKNISNWKCCGDKFKTDTISAKFQFKNFATAFEFMTAVAKEAERIDHHPDWLNSYDKVEINLTTHCSGGVTNKDIELATIINEIAIYYQNLDPNKS